MVQMHQNGELIEELGKIGVRSALLDAKEESKDNDKEKTKWILKKMFVTKYVAITLLSLGYYYFYYRKK